MATPKTYLRAGAASTADRRSWRLTLGVERGHVGRAEREAPITDATRIWLAVLMAFWLLAFGYSFVVYVTTEPSGDGFTRGLNRVTAFLAWQAIAGLLALPVVAIGRSWPKGSGVRFWSAVPFLCAVLLCLVIVGFFVWARFVV